MKFTIKNLKKSEFASHETLCFEATVYVDGKRAFTAFNDGQGACNMYHPLIKKGGGICPESRKLLDAAEEWVQAQPEITEDAAWHKDGKFTFKPDLDHYIMQAVTEVEIMKDFKKTLKKAAFYADGDVRTYYCKPADNGWREQCLKKYPNAIILNDLPEDEAFGHFKQAMGA